MKNPIQPLMKDANSVVRFKGNAIVQHLLRRIITRIVIVEYREPIERFRRFEIGLD